MTAKILVITASILLFLAGMAEAHHILVIQSSQVKPYEEALRGFRQACPHEIFTLVISEGNESRISTYIHEERPRLIVAIGADALEQVKQVRDIPIVFLMTLNPSLIVPKAKNITGIRMKPPPAQQLMLIRKAFPGVRRIGVLYDPAHLGQFMKRAVDAARSLGLELAAREVRSPREVPGALLRLRSEIDVFWMLPDTSVVSPETAEHILLSCGENRVPVISFSRKYVDMGALLSLDIDPYDMGIQAGEMAGRIFSGNDVRTIPHADARKIVIRVNPSVAYRLGFPADLADRLETLDRSER